MLLDDEVHYLVNTATPQIKTLPIGHYPDGAPLVNWREFGGILRICVRPRSLDTLVSALFWVDALVERGHAVPELVLPCLPGARQDRLNPDGDYLFTAKSIARMINERKFPKVITVDPHSDVMPALIERCHSIPAVDVLRFHHFHSPLYVAVIAPDAGAVKRATGVAQYMELPVLHAWKKRSTADGSITGFGIEPTHIGRRGRVLVVDDLCDGGGTFMGLFDLVDVDLNQDVDLFVTHGVFSKGTTDLLDRRYKAIYTTDSVIPASQDLTRGVYRVSVCQQLLEKGTLS